MRASPLPPHSHYHRGPLVSAQSASVRTATRHPRAPGPGHGRQGHGRGTTHWFGLGPMTAPHHVAPPRPDPPPPLLCFFPLSRATDRARSKTRPTHHSSTPSSLTLLCPSSRAPPPSPPISCSDHCPRPREASPSRRILPSVATVFPLSGERPPSLAIPKLKLILSSPFHTGAAGPHTHHRRPSELPPRRRTPLSQAPLPPQCLPIVRVRATPRPPCPASPRRVTGALGVHLTAVGPSANMPPCRPARGDHAVDARAHRPQHGWTGPPGRA
jgi:hypothetical protein